MNVRSPHPGYGSARDATILLPVYRPAPGPGFPAPAPVLPDGRVRLTRLGMILVLVVVLAGVIVAIGGAVKSALRCHDAAQRYTAGIVRIDTSWDPVHGCTATVFGTRIQIDTSSVYYPGGDGSGSRDPADL